MDKNDISRYFAKIGRKGGKSSAARLTKQERVKRARAAGKARAAKAKKGRRK
jgi:hypothetical protein